MKWTEVKELVPCSEFEGEKTSRKKAVETNKRQLSLLPTTARLRIADSWILNSNCHFFTALFFLDSSQDIHPALSWRWYACHGDSPLIAVRYRYLLFFSGCFALLSHDERVCLCHRGISKRRHPEEPWAPKDPAKQEQTATNGMSILPSTQNLISLPICFLSLGELIALP